MAKTYDVIIIGGGIMGSASAYYLMKMDNTLKVAVIERDLTYAKASTTLSMANARIQFSLEQNIAISQYALKTLAQFEDTMAVEGEKPNIYYRREGNLFMVDDAGCRGAEKALALQQRLGCRRYHCLLPGSPGCHRHLYLYSYYHMEVQMGTRPR